MKGLPLALAWTLLGAACTPERGAPAPDALSPLVGKTRAEILACAGTPARTTQQGDAELFVYRALGARRTPGTITRFGERPLEREVFSCEATVTIRNGRVAHVSYGGTTGRSPPTRDEACAAIAANCR
jgi:hypothetical protein